MLILATLRSTILLAFRALPLLLIGFVGFLAIGLGNLGLFILFFGQATVVPAVTTVLHSIFKTYSTGTSDVSRLVPMPPVAGLPAYSGASNNFPSYWMAHISFFFGYLVANAVNVYLMPVDSKAPDWVTNARTDRAIYLMSISIMTLGILSIIRFSLTGAETLGGILLAIVVFGLLGGGWYELASTLGARNSDVFGIVQQMSTQASTADKPMTCVYSASA